MMTSGLHWLTNLMSQGLSNWRSDYSTNQLKNKLPLFPVIAHIHFLGSHGLDLQVPSTTLEKKLH